MTALNQSDELFKLTEVTDLLTRIKSICLSSDHSRLQDGIESFNEHAEHLQEVCKVLNHVSPTDHLQSMTRSSENNLCLYWPQVVNACQSLCFHPSSKHALNNLEVLFDLWLSLYNEIHHLSCAVNDLLNISPVATSAAGVTPAGLLPPARIQLPATIHPSSHNIPSSAHYPGIHAPQAYQKRVTIREEDPAFSSSIPSITVGQQLIPGHHQQHYPLDLRGSPLIPPLTPYIKPSLPHQQLEDPGHYGQPGGQATEEGDEIVGGEEASSGGQVWPDAKDNDIVKRAKAMSSMAFSMYQFTQGEGELKTTQDLFTQAELFADEANMFYKLVRHFTYQVSLSLPVNSIENGHDTHLNKKCKDPNGLFCHVTLLVSSRCSGSKWFSQD
jgi:hypothetical protein